MALADAGGMELKDYLSALRRRRWVIVVVAIGVTAVALILSLLETPIYEAKARVSLQPAQPTFSSSQGSAPSAEFLSTQILVLQSKPVQDLVRTKLGVAPSVSATQLGTTSVVEVGALSIRARQAAAIANAYVDAYLNFNGKQQADALAAQAGEIQTKVDALQKQIDGLGAQLAGIGTCTGTNPPPDCVRRESLQQDRDALVAQQAPFKQRLDELDVDKSAGGTVAQVLTPASVPTHPVRPTPIRNAIMGFGVGLLLGVIAGLMLEYFDESIKGKDDLERIAPDLPVLGIIPTVVAWKERSESHVVSLEDSSSPAAEAYRTLRTSIRFLAVGKPLRIIQVTSPNTAEGKTTTAANLAVALAKAGERVVVVSWDLRRPRMHEFFGMSNAVGFTSVLLGEVPLSSALRRVNEKDQLWFLPSGPRPPNPSELLSSSRAADTLSGLAEFADTVVIDCPPVLPVTDSAIISSRADGTLLVVTAGMTTRKQVARSVELLRQVGAPLVGSVLNNAPSTDGYSYVYQRYDRSPRSSSVRSNGSAAIGAPVENMGVPGSGAAVRPPV